MTRRCSQVLAPCRNVSHTEMRTAPLCHQPVARRHTEPRQSVQPLSGLSAFPKSGGAVSTIPTLDHALLEVHELETDGDDNNDEAMVAACQIVLDGLLEKRTHLPQQRKP